MTVTSDAIQAAVVTALTGATVAGANVISPRSWRTPAALMPLLMVQSPSEQKTSLGRSGAAQYNCRVSLRLVGRIYLKVQADDAAAAAALAAIGLLQRQIEVALINNTALRQAGVQQFSSVRIINDVKTEGELVFGELVMDLGLEFYQGPEDFYPIDGDAIDEFAVYADLINLFSATGDFTGDAHATPFVAAAAAPPRTAGPDGRAEGARIVGNLQV